MSNGSFSLNQLVLRSLGCGGQPFIGAVAKLQDIMQLTNSTRGAAAEPGQGRERMGGEFAGYIPANRAERFREADRR